MKICFVVPKFPVVSETFIVSQITGLIDLDHEIDIISFNKPNKTVKVQPDILKYNLLEKTQYLNIPKNRIIRVFKSFYFILLYFFYGFGFLKSLLKCGNQGLYETINRIFKLKPFIKKKYDAIHCHFASMGNEMYFLKDIIKDINLVISVHGADVNRTPQQEGRNIYDALFEKADCIIANTEYTKNITVQLGCAHNKIKVIPVGLVIEKFHFSEKKVNSGSPITFLTIGRLVNKKGHSIAIKAIKKLRLKHHNVKYIIAGNGPLMGQLKLLTGELCLDEHITFTGPVDEKEALALYDQAHIFIIPCLTDSNGDKEGQCLVLQEAQAMGMPIVSTYHNGIPEGVVDKHSGFLVPENDVEALVDRMEYLINNEDVWPNMGKIGRSFVEHKYDIKILSKKLERLYLTLLKKDNLLS